MSRRLWSYSVGDHGNKVRVYEREPGGVIYLQAPERTLALASGKRRVSLGHRDRKRARVEARRVLSELEASRGASADPTAGYIFDLYRHHHLPTLKPNSQKWVRTNLEAWETFLGNGFRVLEFGPAEWEGFKHGRRDGSLNVHGERVSLGDRKPVSPGTVNLALEALTMVLNWATVWRGPDHRKPLLPANPARGLHSLDDPNVQRSVWTHDQLGSLLAAAQDHKMEVEWLGRREKVPSYLADVIEIADRSGRRIGAVRQLRYSDVRLAEDKLVWRSDTDKAGKAWVTPLTLELRQVLTRVIRGRPGIGDAPLFPAPRNVSQPVGEDTLRLYLRQAQEAAGIPRVPFRAYHAIRRKWVTERKHLPDVDVAKAGGWRSVNTMRRCYQQADDAGVLEALQNPIRLRDRGAS